MEEIIKAERKIKQWKKLLKLRGILNQLREARS